VLFSDNMLFFIDTITPFFIFSVNISVALSISCCEITVSNSLLHHEKLSLASP